MNRSCQTCRYQEPAAHAGLDMMWCRRFPPAPGSHGGWPLVRADEWCGEHWPEGEGMDQTPGSQAEPESAPSRVDVSASPALAGLLEKAKEVAQAAPKGKPGRPRKDASK